MSAFFWSYALLQIPAGWAVDRFGVKWPYAIAFGFWSVASAATALINSLGGFVAMRIGLGVGESIVTPASLSYIRKNFAEKDRGLAIGVYMSGTKWGPALGAPLAAYLVTAYGWRWMFVITGLGCLLWLIPWMLLVRNEEEMLPPRGRQRRRRSPGRICSRRPSCGARAWPRSATCTSCISA